MSELHAKRWIALLATALLVTPVLASPPGAQVSDWPVANPIDGHYTWYNWTLDDTAGYTLDNTTMSGGGLWLAPFDGNFSMNGWALSPEAAVTWGAVAVTATFYWFLNTSVGESIQLNFSTSDDNLSWSPESSLLGNGTSVPIHNYYRWNATLTAPTNLTTPTLWWIGLRTWSNTGPAANAGTDYSAWRNQAAFLNGSSSNDPENDTLLYSWSQVSGPATGINNAAAAMADFLPLELGVYEFMLNVTDGLNYSTDNVIVTVDNAGPIADAGPDQNSVRGANVTLNGTLSSDPNSDPITYNWTQLGGPENVTIGDWNLSVAYFTPTMLGTYSFNLTVMDNYSAAGYDWVDINVLNQGTTADAGADQSVFENDAVMLNGSATTDADGDPLYYNWTQVSGTQTVTLAGADTTAPTFTAPNGAFAAGPYVFNLTAWDTWNATSWDLVVVDVSNRAPTADAGTDQNVVGMTSVVTLDGSLSMDADAEPITYFWWQTGGPAMVAFTSQFAAMTDFTAMGAGSYTFDLYIYDPENTNASDSVIVNVTNAGPSASLVVNPNPILVGAMADVNASASTDDGSIVQYNFTFGDGSDSGNTTFSAVSHSWASAGAYQVNVTVWDNDGVTATTTVTVNVVTDLPPTAVASTTGGTTGDLSTIFGFDDTASTDDNGISAVYWDFGDGSNASTSNPTHQYATRGTFTVTLWVWDTIGQNDSATLTIDVLNRDPTANAGAAQTVPKASAVTLDATGSGDLDGDGLTFLWTQLTGPYTVTLTGGTTDTAAYTPTRAGIYTFSVAVDDGMGGSASAVTTVTAVNAIPLANAGPDQAGLLKGTVVTLDGSGSTDTDDAALLYQWTVVSAQPVTFSAPNAAVTTFTLTAAGVYEFNLTVDDQDNGTDSNHVFVTVWGAAPVADLTANLTAALLGASIHFDGSNSTDAPDGTIVSWMFDFGDGNSTTGSSNSTNYTFPAAGTWNVTLTVMDDEGNTSTAMVTVVITAITTDDPPVADAGSDVTINVGTSFAFDSLSLDDIGVTAWSWDFDDGTANATIDSGTHLYTAVGVYTVTLWVWDILGQNDSDTVTVTVVQPNRSPNLTALANPTATVAGTLVMLIATATDADDDTLTFVWTQTVGPLVTLTTTTGGNRTFTPTEAGTYTFRVNVTDGNGGSGTTLVTVTVTAPSTPPAAADNTLLIVGAILAVLVVLVLFALMASRKKKKTTEGEETDETEEDKEKDSEDDKETEEVAEEEATEAESEEADKDDDDDA